MRGVHLFMLIVLIPALLALGHDIYLFTENSNMDALQTTLNENPEQVKTFFADLGFVWTEYSPETYKQAVDVMDPKDWAIINKILSYKAVFVGLVFAGFFYVLLFLLKILKAGPFRDQSVSSSSSRNGRIDKLMGRKHKKLEYKRK